MAYVLRHSYSMAAPLVAVLGALLGACGSERGGGSLAGSVANCNDAFESLVRPVTPSFVESIRPLAVGAQMPILTSSRAHDEREDLVMRALATACMLDGGVFATGAFADWAGTAVGGAGGSFALGEDIEVEYDAEAGGLRVSAVGEPPSDAQLEPVGWDLAEAKAQEVLSTIEWHGITGSMPYSLLLVTRGGPEGFCTEETPECRAEVDAHRFVFAPIHAGVPIPATPVEVVIGNDGERRSILVTPWDFESDGRTTVAEVSEQGGRNRLVELVEAQHQEEAILWEEEGRIEYSLPVSDASVDMEPIVYGRYTIGDGLPIEVSIPLSDANAPLR